MDAFAAGTDMTRSSVLAFVLVFLCEIPLRSLAATTVEAYPFIYIRGTIEAGDSERIESILRAAGPPAIAIVRIDSDGGDVQAAMSLGRVLRKYKKTVAVESGDRCASACVFILAGAVNRIVAGDVVIHRPYLVKDLPGSAGYDEIYKRTEQLIRAYFAEMNIPEGLVDRMLAVPPAKGELLTPLELERYMLNGEDPAYEEQQTATEANQAGISLAEYRRRQAMQKAVCGWPYASNDPDFFDAASHVVCEQAIMIGRDPDQVIKSVRLVLQKRGEIQVLREGAQQECIERLILGSSMGACQLR
jgi:hypothetical protein